MRTKRHLSQSESHYFLKVLISILLLLIICALTACQGKNSTNNTISTTHQGNTGVPTSSQMTSNESTTLSKAINWGPIKTSKGDIEKFTVNGNVGIGSVAYDIGSSTEGTYIFAIDISDGKLIGDAKVSGRCYAVDVGEKYAFIWVGDVINVYDLKNRFVFVQTLESRGVSNFGNYLFFEDPEATDYLVDKTSLNKVYLNTSFKLNISADEDINQLLYPDCLIGAPSAFNDNGDTPVVYSLEKGKIIGHFPTEYLSKIFAWDHQNNLIFYTDKNKIEVFDISKGKAISELSLTNSEVYAIAASTRNYLSYCFGTGDRFSVIRDFPLSGNGFYYLNGTEKSYVLDSSGKSKYFVFKSQIIGEYKGNLFYKSNDATTLGSNQENGESLWIRQIPTPFSAATEGPNFSGNSILWLCSSSGLKNHGDVIEQWNCQTGLYLNYTEFKGYEVKILSSDPLILATRNEQEGHDAVWEIGGYTASNLPFNMIPDVNITYNPEKPYAGSEAAFTCSVKNIPPEIASQDISFEWDFGDGTKGTGKEITHVYEKGGNYDISVAAKMGNSINAAAAVVSVAVQELPDIYLEATPNTYTKEGLEFVFYCKSQNMGGLSVEWDFGDGQTASSIETSHAFPPGEHTIKAKITNSQKTQSWDKEITILSEYPEFDIDASPPSGPSPLKVTFNPILTSTNLTANGLTFRWTLDSDNVIEEKSFWRTFATVGGHTVFLRVVEPGGDVITLKSVNIIVNTPELTISDGGRKIHSDGSIFVDPKLDPDKDGINQPFEDEAMVKVNPNFELDEDEDWLKNSSDHVANFVRITPYPSVANPEYVLFIYVIAWSRDYGRYPWINYEDHNGDREKVIMAWETIDTNDLELKWVYTSAHGSEACSHSAVWAAWGETTNIGKIWGDDTENMTAALKFEDNHLKLQVSEDKHAIYPTEACGEGVKLAIGGFGEDCGGGLILNFTCYNAGEPDVHLMDDISFIFPNENIWSGNKDHPDKFCGGLEYSEDCPGTLGGYLQSENILNDKLK